MSESLLRVIVSPSLVYLYFELDIEQDEIRKTPGSSSKKLNELLFFECVHFVPFCHLLVFCSHSQRGRLFNGCLIKFIQHRGGLYQITGV